MAYVSVPKDLTRVKNKLVLNLTKRQIVCFSIGALVGLPTFFVTRGFAGNTNAATFMVLIMLPAFLFAMYEKDGQPLEQILMNMYRVKYERPAVRRYVAKTIYEQTSEVCDNNNYKKGGVVGQKKRQETSEETNEQKE